MKSQAEVRKEIRQLAAREQKLTEALAMSIARLESLDDDFAHAKRQRDSQINRKTSGRSYNQAELVKQVEEVRKLREKVVAVRRIRRRRRTRLQRVRTVLRAKRKRLRSMVRPRIIDLQLDFRPMAVQGSINKVIGHYTAGPVDRDTEDAIRLCRMYHTAHLAQGWSGLGYNLCFTRDGNILVLRPAKFVGSHTLGANTGSIGIMMHGSTGDRPTAAQLRALRWWANHGHESIMGAGRMPVRPGSLRWYGHNDFNATSCPGAFKSAYLSKGQKA